MVEVNQLLQLAVDKGASDTIITVGRPPVLRVGGKLRPINTPPLTPDDTIRIMKAITPDRHQTEVTEKGSADYSFGFAHKARFRVAAFKQKGYVALVLRTIPNKILSFQELNLPEMFKNLLTKPRGLILVTGPTGSGKTTTLATMVNFINTEMEKHIITVEDPIEYYHEHGRSVITQREIGVDIASFAEALRRALRQNPDVILVGEMRDLETISAAISAAETGHLVMGTLHTTGAARTVDRIIDVFPHEQQSQIRTQLAASIVAVISQILVGRVDGKGRVAAFEIMVMTPAIENLIRKAETFRIPDQIITGRRNGMILLDEYLYNLHKQKIISYADMIQKAQDPESLQMKVKEDLKRGGDGGKDQSG
ncbi:MAG: type IV pilus twitching motility protein PilT [Planctomycetes bacterium]|nr:type IV pilus twitching motility protein PilT [Planctomycetota bacterium]